MEVERPVQTTFTPITYEQSFSLPENRNEEIVRGASRIMPPASLAHGRLLRRLKKILDPAT